MNIDSIIVAERTREIAPKVEQLAASIERVGLLSPLGVRQVGDEVHLIHGFRRLHALRHLGWTDVPVFFIESAQDELTALLAEGEENTEREPFTVAEAVRHRQRIRQVEARLAKERQGTRTDRGKELPSNLDGSRDAAPEPNTAASTTRHRTAKATGFGATTLDKAEQIVAAAVDPETPEPVREIARESVKALSQHGAKVDAERRKVEEAYARHVDGDQTVQDTKYLHAFLKHLNRFEMSTWDAERIGELASADDIEAIDLALEQVAAWHKRYTKARSGLRLMKGGAR